jgi:hypothetical protein
MTLEICNAINIIGFGAPLKAQNSLSYRSGSSGKWVHVWQVGPRVPGRPGYAGSHCADGSGCFGFLPSLTTPGFFVSFLICKRWMFSIDYNLCVQSSSGVTLFSRKLSLHFDVILMIQDPPAWGHY